MQSDLENFLRNERKNENITNEQVQKQMHKWAERLAETCRFELILSDGFAVAVWPERVLCALQMVMVTDVERCDRYLT